MSCRKKPIFTLPSKAIVPLSYSWSFDIILSKVDFPAPFYPTRAILSPAISLKLIPANKSSPAKEIVILWALSIFSYSRLNY
jgi:hypothetical protein